MVAVFQTAQVAVYKSINTYTQVYFIKINQSNVSKIRAELHFYCKKCDDI